MAACKDILVNGKTYSGISKVMAKDCSEDKYTCFCCDEDATATEDCILSGKTAYAKGKELIGTIATYDGETEITPSETDIVLDTQNKYINENIVIKKSSGGGTNFLQWKCDNIKSLRSEFKHYTGDSLSEFINGLNTSNVTSFYETFYYNRNLIVDFVIDGSNATDCSYAFYYCSKLTYLPIKNLAKLEDADSMFLGCVLIENFDTEEVGITSHTLESVNAMFNGCSNLKQILNMKTSKCTNFSQMCNNCTSLETVETLDLIKASYFSSVFNGCTNLKNLKLKNIKMNIQIGSGTTYGHLLTVESLTNTIKELWDMSSSSMKTLTIGNANLSKLSNVYVKLVDITDGMRVEDEYIDNKLPFVVCESTDEGAMSIIDYALTLKNWDIK